MSTRGLTGFRLRGKYRAMYNHMDSYPSELGANMVELAGEITRAGGWAKFAANTKKLKDLGQKTVTDDLLVIRYYRYSGSDIPNERNRDPYQLLRNVQGSYWLEEVYRDRLEHYIEAISFIKDSLSCEWCWFFNLDEHTLECWKGRQRTPSEGNPFGTKKMAGFYPCLLIKSWPLEQVPETWLTDLPEN